MLQGFAALNSVSVALALNIALRQHLFHQLQLQLRLLSRRPRRRRIAVRLVGRVDLVSVAQSGDGVVLGRCFAILNLIEV